MQTQTTKTNGTNGHANHVPNLATLSLEDLDAHPNNPRKTFTAIDELAQSIAAHGLLEPIIVRPKGKRYEIVCGERRFRASKKAKAAGILALVRDLDDKTCEVLMVEENTKRSDLHPLEEAEGYERLRKVHGMTVEEIAATVSKTPATVYARMKLCALCKAGRDACYAGTISPSVALYIARIPSEKLQLEALKELEELAKDTNGRETDDEKREANNGVVEGAATLVTPVGEREAFGIIRRHFMLRLADAPFDIADAKLTKAGACTTCPNRTGNQAELFSDVKSADVCTLLTCYREKRDAVWSRRVEQAKTDGQKVLSSGEAKKNFESYDKSRLSWNSEFVDVDQVGYVGSKANTTYRKVLGEKLPQTILARDPDGGIHELVKKADVERRAAATPAKLSPAAKKQREADKVAQKKADAKGAVERRCTELAISAIAEKAEGKQPNVDLWRALLVAELDDNMSQLAAEILVARKLVSDDQAAYDLGTKGIVRLASKLSEKTARAVLIEIIATKTSFHNYGTRSELREERGAFDMLCDFYKVDPKKFQAEAKASVGGAK